MKPAKLMVLGIAGVSGLGAAFFSSSLMKAPVVAPVQQISQEKMTEVLVAANELGVGTQVTADRLRWQRWPVAAVSELMLTRENAPDGLNDISGSIARAPVLAGEPVRRDKMIKGANGGFMSAVLPSGMRAVAINIVSSGAKTAGGFVLPNDRVDIIKTGRDEESTKAREVDVFASDTILQNIRVLAIGQNIQERNGEKVVIGETATLELDPKQAELITLAQRTGDISLTLRSLADVAKPSEVPVAKDEAGLTVIRYGVSQSIGKK
ncbi:MAG: Flp pilus assembly protein CpaB [Beijerinckiaceae bacterium]